MKLQGDSDDKLVIFGIYNTTCYVKLSDTDFIDVIFGIESISIDDLRQHSSSLYKKLLDASNSKNNFIDASVLLHSPSSALKCALNLRTPKIFFLPSLLYDISEFLFNFINQESSNIIKVSNSIASLSNVEIISKPIEDPFDFNKFLEDLDTEVTAKFMKNSVRLKERGISKKECFKGVELVDYFCDSYGLDRDEGLRLCNHFINNDYVEVISGKTFADSSKCLCIFTDPAIKHETKEEEKKRKADEKLKKREERKQEKIKKDEERKQEKIKRQESKKLEKQKKEDAKKGIISEEPKEAPPIKEYKPNANYFIQ